MSAQHTSQRAGGTSREVAVLITLLIVFAAIAVWAISRFDADYEEITPYSTLSSDPVGVRALWLLCQEAGMDSAQYYASEYDYPDHAAMVVLLEDGLDSGEIIFNPPDVSAMLDWVDEGNCLVLCLPPDSILSSSFLREFSQYDNSAAYTADPRVAATYAQNGQTGQATAMSRVYQPGLIYDMPADVPPIWQGVKRFETASMYSMPWLDVGVLLATSTPPDPVVLQIPHGQGEVLWLTRPEIATNHWLSRADNAQMMWGLLSYAARYGTVYFDEGIHGYQETHKNTLQLVFTTPGGWLLLAGLGSILLLMLGNAVLPARIVVRPVPPRRDSTEMVLAQADLFRRAKVTGMVGRSLLDSYRRALQTTLRQPLAADEGAFRQLLQDLTSKSGGGRPWVAHYVSTGAVPRRPAELLAFSQELGSLLEHARRRRG